MKHKTPFLILTTTAMILVGCDEKQTTSQQLDGAQKDATAVARNIKNYSYSEREEFVKSERTRLIELNRDLDDLAARVERSSDAVKAEANQKLAILRDQVARLNRQLDDVGNTTESAWDKFKDDVRATQDASEDEFNKARQWLSEKVAP